MNNMAGGYAQSKAKARPASVAGAFYPNDAKKLKSMTDSLFRQTSQKHDRPVQAVIVPHAGYMFSGAIAAEAFSTIAPESQYKRIILIGPSHRASFDGASVDNAFQYIATPLGNVKTDNDFCSELLDKGAPFCYLPQAHTKEHCLEVQLPFLMSRLKDMPPIVPIIIGTQNPETITRTAELLAPYFKPENLFVISSDFSHYPSYNDACHIDRATKDAIMTGSYDAFLRALDESGKSGITNLYTCACGQCGIEILLQLIEKRPDLKICHLAYCNSGDSPYGDREKVVGYHAFNVTSKTSTTPESPRSLTLTHNEKQELLHIARSSIEYALQHNGKLIDLPYPQDTTLQKTYGAFVTLRINGHLRGCIGNLKGYKPLYKTVSTMAYAAAFEDPRFSPLTIGELPNIRIEISVLSPLKRIHSINDFQPGKHGIYIVKGKHNGTYLPQVALETKWSKEELLEHCAHDKAGLTWDGWRNAELYVYEAEVFSEP